MRRKESILKELERAVSSLSKNIANFPIGAASINDLRPTEERIRDTREALKALSAKMLMLRAKMEAQRTSDVQEEGEEDTYVELQERIAHLAISNKAIEFCLQNSSTQDILENAEDDEISEALRKIMHKLFTLNDHVMSLEQTRAEAYSREIELKCELQESLSEFRDFLKQQEDVRKKKLQETNPEIARQKESIHRRLQKINVMKRLITNLAAASADVVKKSPELQKLWKKHRELLGIETIQEMAKETDLEDS